MKYRFYRISPITENTVDPIKVYLDKLAMGSDGDEDKIKKVESEREKYRSYGFVKYKEPQKHFHMDVYGFLELDAPFPVNLFGGPGWSEMVVVM